MPNATTTTFRNQTISTRLRMLHRRLMRLQYPLSELSEGFDIERNGASSLSASTRRSVSSWRPPQDANGSPFTHPENQNSIDIIVVEKSDELDRQPGMTEQHEPQTTIHGSEQGSTHYTDRFRPSAHFISNRLWPFLRYFFDPAFQDPVKERHYVKESWFLSKRIALITSLFYYIAWGLILGLLSRPWYAFEKIAWIGVSGLFVLPMFPAVLLDMPRRIPLLWQIYLLCTTYMWPLLFSLQLLRCHYYSAQSTCGSRDFVGLFFYLCAMPTVALLAFDQNRFFHLLGTLASLLYIAIALVPLRQSWIRHFFNYLLFQTFMLYVSYAREKGERKVFSLREQLKTQYKATQKAQVAESRASDSKKRFVNYIFHEVRVPLNTALLSVQNLIGEDALKGITDDHLELVDVLQSSLGMMEKVLNDVLDFNRMESGRLMVTNAPFDFTKVIRSVVMSLNVAATSKRVTLTSQLDRRIEEFGFLIGDEMRLRQILSNLTSNACKFTSEGGSVTLKTSLVAPTLSSTDLQLEETSRYKQDSDITAADRSHHTAESKRDQTVSGDKITVRMEVVDSGIGIRPQDVSKDRLFSPYVQTEMGKRQGGKGTGLGLALVRNIVQLSGGRLGLRSTIGKGSTFWIEQDFSLADPTLLTRYIHATSTESSSSASVGIKGENVVISVTESPRSGDVISTALDVPEESDVFPVSSAANTSTIQAPRISVEVPRPDIGQRPRLEHLHTSEIELVNIPSVSNSGEQSAPVSAKPPSPTNKHKKVLLPPDVRPLRILVVDDDSLTRRLMTRMITRLGHSVESAENGLLALRLLKADLNKADRDTTFNSFDLVFLDNQMPVLSGVEMVNHARLEGIDTIVCGVTGNAMKEDQDEYLEAGADFVLTKPVMEASIKTIIQHALDKVVLQADKPRELPRSTIVSFPIMGLQ